VTGFSFVFAGTCGLSSGIEGEQRTSALCTLREGRVILEEFFLEHDQALKAVGPEE
jgi:hypothetical protein